VQVVEMTVMEGVIFGDQTDSFHSGSRFKVQGSRFKAKAFEPPTSFEDTEKNMRKSTCFFWFNLMPFSVFSSERSERVVKAIVSSQLSARSKAKGCALVTSHQFSVFSYCCQLMTVG
jgi:hypothetical protein